MPEVDTVSFWRHQVTWSHISPVFASAGSDEEYIYMNKVSVNSEQNSASPDKGMGP